MLKSLSAPVSPWLKARTLRDKRAVTKKVLSLPSECGSCAVCTCRCSAEVQPTLAAKCNMRNTRPRSQKAWARTLTNMLLPRHYIPLHLEKLAEWQCNASRCNLKDFRPLVAVLENRIISFTIRLRTSFITAVNAGLPSAPSASLMHCPSSNLNCTITRRDHGTIQIMPPDAVIVQHAFWRKTSVEKRERRHAF